MLAERDAAPAVGPRKSGSGAPRVTVRPDYAGLPFSGLVGDRRKGGESRLDQVGRNALHPALKVTVPGWKKSPRWSAERRASFAKDATPHQA